MAGMLSAVSQRISTNVLKVLSNSTNNHTKKAISAVGYECHVPLVSPLPSHSFNTQHVQWRSCLHTLTDNTAFRTSRHDILLSEDRGILRPGEILYNIRIGSGDLLKPPVTMFDNTVPYETVNLYLNVLHKDSTLLDNIVLSSYNADTFTPYSTQPDEGAFSDSGTILNYSFTSVHQTNMMCCISIHSDCGMLMGRSYLSLDHIATLGQEDIKLPVVNDTDSIVGTLACSVIEITGLDIGLETEEHLSYQKWEQPTKAIEIGHRGCGITDSDKELLNSLPCLPENTIASLTMAYQHGADMVETDVVVTQDLKPVIYHDLEIHVSSSTLPISHVTSNILKSLPLPTLEVSRDQAVEQLFGGACEEVQRHVEMLIPSTLNVFPSLREVLAKTPEGMGILLEVKSNLQMEGVPQTPYHNKNVYVDVILSELMHHAGNRQIVFCSFCPTTCIMLRNKQNRWPVVLTVQGVTDTYPDYTDKRLSSLETCAKLALSENLYGLSIFSGILLGNCHDTISALKKAGLAIYTWGHHNCDKQFRQKMRQSNVDGLIYDRIYEEDLRKRSFEGNWTNSNV